MAGPAPIGVPCPVCGREGATYPAESVTLCDECGSAVHPGDARLLLIGPETSSTFCSPECLRRHETGYTP